MKLRSQSVAACLLAALLSSACDRERRDFGQPPASPRLEALPRESYSASLSSASYEDTAYAIAQGKQWFGWFNCSGCHAHGGGNIGPALMDAKWIYGHEPGEIFASIMEGRPNGMPAFRNRIADSQVWQLVAYVRSMSALVQRDAIAGRDDGIQKGKAEQRRARVSPVDGTASPAQ
jgi:cytochrome c oxidase cbb3-type subunit 3